MAKFSFRKAKTDEETDLPELVEGEEGAAELDDAEDADGGGGRTRRLLILLGLVVILAGGGYLAWNLFLEPPPPPPPVRPMPAPAAKAPTPPASPAPSTPAPEAKAPAPASPAPTAPAPAAKAPAPAKAGTKTAPAPPAAKASEKAPAAKAAAKVEPKPAATAGSFSVQVGAMAMQENAERLRRQLEEKGFTAAIRQGTAHLAKHVVTVGDFGGKREAEELSRRLTVDGFPSQLLAQDGKFAPQIGAFFSLDEAIDLARELQKKNHAPKITSRQVDTTVYQVRHGSFASRAEAVKRGEELRTKGFPTFMVVRE
jgi:cell division septation protein DedD